MKYIHNETTFFPSRTIFKPKVLLPQLRASFSADLFVGNKTWKFAN